MKAFSCNHAEIVSQSNKDRCTCFNDLKLMNCSCIETLQLVQ